MIGCESTRTLSSIGTDLADDLSSRYTLEHAEDVLDEHSLDDWDANGKERNFILMKTKGCLGTEVLSEYWQYQWEKEFSGVSLMPNSGELEKKNNTIHFGTLLSLVFLAWSDKLPFRF